MAAVVPEAKAPVLEAGLSERKFVRHGERLHSRVVHYHPTVAVAHAAAGGGAVSHWRGDLDLPFDGGPHLVEQLAEGDLHLLVAGRALWRVGSLGFRYHRLSGSEVPHQALVWSTKVGS